VSDALRPEELIPGAERWPRFVRNRSEQYEARLCLVRVPRSTSVLLAGMHESVLPIAVAHGEGLAEFTAPSGSHGLLSAGLGALQYVDHYGQPTEAYPFNPNGSPLGLAVFAARRPRHLADAASGARVPDHPALVGAQGLGEDGGWMRLFRNARVFAA